MKIACIAFDYVRSLFLNGIVTGLRSRGHTVQLFIEHGAVGGTVSRFAWTKGNMQPITDFAPDRVVIFNGFAQQVAAVTAHIKAYFPTIFVERGWLPQRGYLYMDREGLGGRSSLARMNLSTALPGHELSIEKNFRRLRQHYTPGARPADLPDRYIAVPLQLEKDTSILLDSPHIKTMRKLAFFLVSKFPKEAIVFKTHPYDPGMADVIKGALRSRTNYRCYGKEVTMSTLAFHSEGVIGINSTSIIESLAHLKPIAMLGSSVISSSSVSLASDFLLDTPQRFLLDTPPAHKVKSLLYQLSKIQFLQNNPPERALKYIEDTPSHK